MGSGGGGIKGVIARSTFPRNWFEKGGNFYKEGVQSCIDER